MTDEELIGLVENSSPDDLTFDQLVELKARMKNSSQLREALRSQLRFHQAMCRTYSGFSASLGAILGQAVAPAAASPLSSLYGWGLSGFAVMIVASVTVLQTVTLVPHLIHARPQEAEVIAEPEAPADPGVSERYVELSRPPREVKTDDLQDMNPEDMPMPSPSDHPPSSPVAKPAPPSMPPLCTSPSEDFPDPRDGASNETDDSDEVETESPDAVDEPMSKDSSQPAASEKGVGPAVVKPSPLPSP